MNNEKILLPMIRKLLPVIMAKNILGIQSITAKAEEILSIRDEGAWSNWRKTTSIWPRRSIDGKIIFGRINKRGRMRWEGIRFSQSRSANFQEVRTYEFATNKELFKAKLEGTA